MNGEGHVQPGRAWPDLVAAPAAIGAMLLMLVTLPVSLPIALLLGRNDRRRLEAGATVTPCSRCGTLLGPDAPAASDAAHMAAFADLQRRHPTHRVHLARRAQARCPACGADHVWDGKRRTLHLLADPGNGSSRQVDQHAEEER